MFGLNKNNAVYLLLSFSFILCLLVTSISNESVINLTIKFIGILTYTGLTIIKIKLEKILIRNIFGENVFVKLITVILLLLTFTGLTLLYTDNPGYGYWKWANLILIITPLLILTFINLHHITKDFIKMFNISVIVYLLLISTVIILIQPFDYGIMEYKLEFNRWSHVVIGRVNSFLFLYYLLYAFLIKEKVSLATVSILILSGYSIYIAGLRAALLGLLLILPFILMIILTIKKSFAKTVYLTATLLIIFSIILFSPVEGETQTKRFEVLKNLDNLEVVDDGAVNARLQGWRLALEMYANNPVLGTGIGGYNQDYYSEIPQIIKYPHNIFLELLVEYGVVGIILSILLVSFFIKYFIFIVRSVITKKKWVKGTGYMVKSNARRVFRSTAGSNRQLAVHCWQSSVGSRQLVNSNKYGVRSKQSDIRKFGTETFILIFLLGLFALFLALFSKDVSSNSLLWVSLVLLIQSEH